MSCLLCVAAGAIGMLAASLIISVVVGKLISHGANYINERSDAAWAELTDEDSK